MKKAPNAVKNKMVPNLSVLEGIPARDPHKEFAEFDANFKRRRGTPI